MVSIVFNSRDTLKITDSATTYKLLKIAMDINKLKDTAQ
jgi:hypothetical protein